MTHHVQLSPRAARDAENAYLWLRERAPHTAARWYNRLLEAVQSLERLPERCGLAPEAESLGIELRQLLYGKRSGVYRILFTVEGDVVRVHRIRRAAQRLLDPDDLS